MELKKAVLVLEDGLEFWGFSCAAADGEVAGEVVFNTSMWGYQEILTDPSYKGQIVVMTPVEIGNYGVNPDDMESDSIKVEGFVVKRLSKFFNTPRKGSFSLYEFLKKHNTVAIEGVDTRYLVRHIRDKGSMKGIISTICFDTKKLREKVKAFPSIVGQDLVKYVSCKEPYIFKKGGEKRVVVWDFGVKRGILRHLAGVGFEVYVASVFMKADEILELKPDALCLSNGPGDPKGVLYLLDGIRKLVIEERLPTLGICLGHQLLALAFGIDTYKLKFGHHGGNHPVCDLKTKNIYISVQNHCFAVEKKEIEEKGFELWFINLNDNTVEGMRHKELPIISVQFHPEASPGPTDTSFVFDEFYKLTLEYK